MGSLEKTSFFFSEKKKKRVLELRGVFFCRFGWLSSLEKSAASACMRKGDSV